ncbi:MAG: class I SAM-dependent methyltransferase [Ramlibacter sp.]|nr:class I SAM-dependent methyltransferase [Ramlibacter sp.]
MAVTLKPELHQWFTPRWVCEAIIERHYRDLDMGHTVLEPCCGDGRFLQALPAEVPAMGVEIDPVLAEHARAATGRPVITGDFLTADVPGRFTHVIGNPPFDAKLIHGFLARAHDLLHDGGLCGLLLPAYVLQTSSRVMAMNRRWSISQELMPRNIFPGLHLPLVFACFRKDQARTLVGFFLYREALDVAAMPSDVQQALQQPARGSVWRHAVRAAFARLGRASAALDDLYATVERPSANQFWREKVRQTLQAYPEFRRERAGTWAIASNLEAAA